MKIAKRSNLVRGRQDLVEYARDLDADVKSLFFAMQGRVRFGDGADESAGENISGKFMEITSDGSADTEFQVIHNIGSVPSGFIVLWQDKAGSLYQAPDTGTAWSDTSAYLKCDVSSLTAKVFFLK